VPAGIANARARSLAAPIAYREPQKSTGGGRKCSQLFSVEREGGGFFWGLPQAGGDVWFFYPRREGMCGLNSISISSCSDSAQCQARAGGYRCAESEAGAENTKEK
jgi:hypothetical protein